MTYVVLGNAFAGGFCLSLSILGFSINDVPLVYIGVIGGIANLAIVALFVASQIQKEKNNGKN